MFFVSYKNEKHHGFSVRSHVVMQVTRNNSSFSNGYSRGYDDGYDDACMDHDYDRHNDYVYHEDCNCGYDNDCYDDSHDGDCYDF